MINISKQLVRTRTDIKVDIAMYVASYNEIEQLHMQALLNCHLATF